MWRNSLTTEREPDLQERDRADREAKSIADDAEAFNRNYSTITTEQANDLARALSAISAALGRVMQ